jgi:hypothetical protein
MKTACTSAMARQHLEALKRFNEWEKRLTIRPGPEQALKTIFKMVDLIPEKARQKPVDVKGIEKMREMLACLS